MGIGLVWVVVAALALGLGALAQGIAAARHAGSLGGLVVQPLFLLGLVLDGVGFLAHVLALRSVPMAVAQGAVSASLAVTALGARLLLGARFRARETVAVLGVCVGLGLLAVMSDGTTTVAASGALQVGLAVATLVLALATAAVRLVAPAHRGPATAVLSGLAFAVCSTAVRVLDTSSPLAVLADPTTPILLVAVTVGGLAWVLALRDAPVTTVTAIAVAAEVVPPSLLGPWVLGDAVASGFVVVAPLVLGATALAGVVLARVPRATTEPAGPDQAPADRAALAHVT